jgi:hypothetical protein
MSLGGYLAARAAAFEPRFKAAIFFDGIYSLYDSVRGALSPDALDAFDARRFFALHEVVGRKCKPTPSCGGRSTRGYSASARAPVATSSSPLRR